jgi:hypothetical protein
MTAAAGRWHWLPPRLYAFLAGNLPDQVITLWRGRGFFRAGPA